MCKVKGCNRKPDGILFRGNEVCKYHENKHWNSNGGYIWKKLGIPKEEYQGKELQLELAI